MQRPGLVSISPGSRTNDALQAAGGPRPEADLSKINLAAPVKDGSQIVVPQSSGPHSPSALPAASSAGGSGAGLVNLNTASQAELDALPGVGQVTAQRIIAWRTEHGQFTSVDELQEIDGIGPKTFAQLKEKVGV